MIFMSDVKMLVPWDGVFQNITFGFCDILDNQGVITLTETLVIRYYGYHKTTTVFFFVYTKNTNTHPFIATFS